MKDQDLTLLMARLNYQFKNIDILKQALSKENKHLAYIGDKLINAWGNEKINQLFGPGKGNKKRRGKTKTQYYNSLVANRTLYLLAEKLGLIELCMINTDAPPRGRWRKTGDFVEAVFAAIYFDCGKRQDELNLLLDKIFAPILEPIERALSDVSH